MESGMFPLNSFPPRSRMVRLLSLTICVSSSIPCKPLLETERHSNEVMLNSSSGRLPVRLLWSAFSTLSLEQLPRPGGILPLIMLYSIPFHNVDVNCPRLTKGCRWQLRQVSPELVEAEIEDDNASGGHQFLRRATG
ncbi:hypothetical protein U9M48_025678 [Paspalum notatum var. saurae]|uniref:Uncharacterized protein n=1 Tax=Paspalum notatum var. saurae TaxID=547442 RepID=A0AAQ3WXZ0_PASNO